MRTESTSLLLMFVYLVNASPRLFCVQEIQQPFCREYLKRLFSIWCLLMTYKDAISDAIQPLVLNRRLVFLQVSAVDELPVLREIKGLPSVSHNAQTAVIFIKLQLSRE
ncbi:hypothetical protein MP228_001684 [Amoeboaphelidium protococcarum]|nr:hypothetical protein MP228_001684 [Amoeboaphelidium protococcarum]